MVRCLAALLLLAAAPAAGGAPRAALQVSATVVRSVTVSVRGTERGPLLHVRTGATERETLVHPGRREPGEARASACETAPNCVMVTLHADAAPPRAE